jgi:hypothetical protein
MAEKAGLALGAETTAVETIKRRYGSTRCRVVMVLLGRTHCRQPRWCGKGLFDVSAIITGMFPAVPCLRACQTMRQKSDRVAFWTHRRMTVIEIDS